MSMFYDKQVLVNSKGRSYYYNNVKFFLILLVVVGHFVSRISYMNGIAKGLDLSIYSFHMPAFIFISGYLSKGCAKSWEKTARRSLTFLVIYMIAQILFDFVQREIAHNITKPFNFLKPRIGLWYLVVLIGYTLTQYFLAKYSAKKVLPVLLCVGLAVGWIPGVGEPLSLSRFFVFWPFFMAGHYVDKSWFERLNQPRVKQCGAVFLILMILSCYGMRGYLPRDIFLANTPYSQVSEVSTMQAFLSRGLWYGVVVCAMISFFALVPRGRFFFSVMGERTLQIYLMHSILVRMLFVTGILTDFAEQTGVIPVIGSAIALTFFLGTNQVTKLWNFPKKLLQN